MRYMPIAETETS